MKSVRFCVKVSTLSMISCRYHLIIMCYDTPDMRIGHSGMTTILRQTKGVFHMIHRGDTYIHIKLNIHSVIREQTIECCELPCMRYHRYHKPIFIDLSNRETNPIYGNRIFINKFMSVLDIKPECQIIARLSVD